MIEEDVIRGHSQQRAIASFKVYIRRTIAKITINHVYVDAAEGIRGGNTKEHVLQQCLRCLLLQQLPASTVLRRSVVQFSFLKLCHSMMDGGGFL